MTTNQPIQQDENFAQLLEESFQGTESLEGKVVEGTIIAEDNDAFIIDVGLKSEGRVEKKELGSAAKNYAVGSKINIFVDRLEDRHGEIVLSFEKARREEVWKELEVAFDKSEKVLGVMTSRVKGGFTVDLSGAIAFLPGSQVDIRQIKDTSALMDIEQPFMILKMDRLRGNIVVSRRAVLEETRAEARSEILEKMHEGLELDGVVKNVTDYGAFVDLGGVDGLLHLTDISWQRINHPSDVLEVGQKIRVKITKFNEENKRISLGMKQLEADPWIGIEDKFKLEDTVKGKVTNITDYRVFVELEHGIEGLVHASEISWSKKSTNPQEVMQTGQEVEVKIIEMNLEKRRIGLSLRQCLENPWHKFANDHKAGDTITGTIQNITDFGLFVNVAPDIDGLVHMNDISWDESGEQALKNYKIGQEVTTKILDIHPVEEKVVLGIKQLSGDPFAEQMGGVKSGDVVTCTIKKVQAAGLDVVIGDQEVPGFIKKVDLARDRGEQRADRFAVDERVDALVTSIDHKNRRFTLSIKAREVKEEKEAMAEFGSSDSGASLGDILGSSLDLDKVKEGSTKKD
ncbi:MAG: 30S ribosomal protein S1 [Rickettsiales bacterium]|nr:30S ribosomal protein S1 [Rickettsiales bacterium]|tara:strand:+ start:20377 stop:22092 length:1716 start_codon:yes stop_codon:yes gene_type:complete